MDTKAKGYLRSAVSAIPEKSSSQALQFGEHLNETHDSLKPGRVGVSGQRSGGLAI